MDDLSRTEYPALLDHLVPGQAMAVLQERIRRISKNNQDIADWIQERRKVEDQYAASLKKLATFKGPTSSTELGVFQSVWDSITRSAETSAGAHHNFSDSLFREVETPLRSFQNKKEFSSMTTITANLQAVAKEIDDAQDKAEKLSRKGGKNNAQKLSAATQRLESATQQWDSQAPFIFETLQVLDEQRTEHLRGVLTQLETFEVDQASQVQSAAASLVNQILEVQTADEIQTYVHSITQSRPKIDRRNNTRRASVVSSFVGNASSYAPNAGATSASEQAPPAPAPAADRYAGAEQAQAPAHTAAAAFTQPAPSAHSSSYPAPPAPPSREGTNLSEHSTMSRQDLPPLPQQHQESSLRSRIGTVFGRRRQSVQAGFGQLSPSKGSSGPFGRLTVSSHGRAVSPRASSTNLAESHNRLSSLAETPDSPNPARTHANGAPASLQSGGSRPGSSIAQGADAPAPTFGSPSALDRMTASDLFGVAAPPGPPPSQQQTISEEPPKDAEGFSVRPEANDPISRAQREAAAAGSEQLGEDAEAAFKVSIQEEPVAEEDPEDKQAALHNVANTLSLGMPTRKTGTVRGRRDVRNTIYVPAGSSVAELPSFAMPPIATASTSNLSRASTFASVPTPTRPTAGLPMAPDSSFAGSDTHSIRSTASAAAHAVVQHILPAEPGLGVSIIESVSAKLEGEELKDIKISGEAAFAYVGGSAPPAAPPAPITIKVNNFSLLEAIGPNPDLLRATPSPDEFILNSGRLHARPAVAFNFRMHLDNDESHKTHCLFQFKPEWKPVGEKLGLIIHARLNPLAPLQHPVVLRNVAFAVRFNGTAASVLAKPSCTHYRGKRMAMCHMPDHPPMTSEWRKVVTMRIIGDKGTEPKPGRIDCRWDFLATAESWTPNGNSLSISRKTDAAPIEEEEEDPFADAPTSPKPTNGSAAAWASVPAVLQISSGVYGTDN